MSTNAEVYKGTEITIVTIRRGEGEWTSRATYAIAGRDPVQLELAHQSYASESEARQAALQAAVENIDRARSSIGKP